MYCPKEQPMDACSSSSKIIAVGGCTEVFEWFNYRCVITHLRFEISCQVLPNGPALSPRPCFVFILPNTASPVVKKAVSCKKVNYPVATLPSLCSICQHAVWRFHTASEETLQTRLQTGVCEPLSNVMVPKVWLQTIQTLKWTYLKVATQEFCMVGSCTDDPHKTIQLHVKIGN